MMRLTDRSGRLRHSLDRLRRGMGIEFVDFCPLGQCPWSGCVCGNEAGDEMAKEQCGKHPFMWGQTGSGCAMCALEKNMNGRDELMALIPVLQNMLTVMTPERVTRLERLVCAMLRNGIHSHPAKGEFAADLVRHARLIEQALNQLPPGIPGYTREGFTLECQRQLFRMSPFHQENSRAVAEELANVFYLKPDTDFSEVPPLSLAPETHIQRIENAIGSIKSRDYIMLDPFIIEILDAIGCLRKSLKDREL